MVIYILGNKIGSVLGRYHISLISGSVVHGSGLCSRHSAHAREEVSARTLPPLLLSLHVHPALPKPLAGGWLRREAELTPAQHAVCSLIRCSEALLFSSLE